MIVAPSSDIAGIVKAAYCGSTANSGAPLLITAAGTGDNTAVTGKSIDRLGYSSAVVVLPYLAALQATETLSLAVEIQDSADNSAWNTAVALKASAVVDTGLTGGTNEYGVVELEVDLSGYARYIRINFTPDLSASGTDTAMVQCIVCLGGADNLDAA